MRLKSTSLLIFLLCGCGGSDAPSGIMRLFDPEPSGFLEATDLYELRTVFVGDLSDELEQGRWLQVRPKAKVGSIGSGLRLQFSEPRLVLRRQGLIDAEQIKVLDVEIEGLGDGQVFLSWTSREVEGELGKTDRVRVRTRDALTIEGQRRLFRFDLRGHRNWRGELGAIRLVVHSSVGSPVTLVRLQGSSSELNPEVLAEVAVKSWKATLANETRNVRLGLQGQAFEWAVEVVPGALLELGTGLHPGLPSTVDFEVTLTPSDGGAERVVHRSRLAAEESYSGGWIDHSIDLSDFVGQKVLLRFDTKVDEGDREMRFALWSDPRIVSRRQPQAMPNLVLISVDTLRADRLSIYGHTVPTSPRIDRWVRERGVLFREAVVQAPWTLPSHISMMTGLDAFHHGVNHGSRSSPADLEMLAERLRAAGYFTAAVTGGGFVHPRFGFTQGFDTFYAWPEGDSGELEEILQRSLAWLEGATDRPFFLFIHTYEVHGPFRPRQPFYDEHPLAPTVDLPDLASLQPVNKMHHQDGFRTPSQRFVWQASDRAGDPVRTEELASIQAMYDSAVRFVDDAFGQIDDTLQRLGLDERTLVILTSDHGESLGEENRAGHGYLYENNLLVPLLMAFPEGLGAGSIVDQQVRSIDIVPTVLEGLGLPAAEGIDGKSLLPLLQGTDRTPREAWTYASSSNSGMSLRLGDRLKYVFNSTAWSPIHSEGALFDIRRDPAELSAIEDPVILERLRSRMQLVIEKQLPGLRIEFHNTTQAPLKGTLTSSAITATTIASWDKDCLCIEWDRMGRLQFRVPAEVRFTLWLERWQGESVEVEGVQDDARFRFTMASDVVERPWAVLRTADEGSRAEGGFSVSRTPTESTSGLVISSQGSSVTPVQPMESELREQLEALGYLQ